MGKTLCKDKSKNIKKQGKAPKYYCRSCGAEAVKEKHLCKPKKI